MKKEITTIKEETVLSLAKKDLTAYQENKKSYELINWLKDELVLRQNKKLNRFQISNKALARCISCLGYLRENMLSLDIKVLDKETSIVSFVYDLTTLTNGQRRRYNQEFGCNFEEITEDETDETYAHLI